VIPKTSTPKTKLLSIVFPTTKVFAKPYKREANYFAALLTPGGKST
jgi:hypothetical protein